MCIECIIEGHSCNDGCSGKALSGIHCECVCVSSVSYPACNAEAAYCHL